MTLMRFRQSMQRVKKGGCRYCKFTNNPPSTNNDAPVT